MHVCLLTLYIILVFLFIMRVFSKTHQSSLTLKGGSTAFPKPLSPQGTGDVPTAPPRRSEPFHSMVGGPSEVYASFLCGMGPQGEDLLKNGCVEWDCRQDGWRIA